MMLPWQSCCSGLLLISAWEWSGLVLVLLLRCAEKGVQAGKVVGETLVAWTFDFCVVGHGAFAFEAN